MPATAWVAKAAVTPEGRPEIERETSPEKPPLRAMVTWTAPLDPCWMSRFDAERVMENEPEETSSTLRATVAVAFPTPFPEAVIVMVELPTVALPDTLKVSCALDAEASYSTALNGDPRGDSGGIEGDGTSEPTGPGQRHSDLAVAPLLNGEGPRSHADRDGSIIPTRTGSAISSGRTAGNKEGKKNEDDHKSGNHSAHEDHPGTCEDRGKGFLQVCIVGVRPFENVGRHIFLSRNFFSGNSSPSKWQTTRKSSLAGDLSPRSN